VWQSPKWAGVFRDVSMTVSGIFVIIWSTVFGGDAIAWTAGVALIGGNMTIHTIWLGRSAIASPPPQSPPSSSPPPSLPGSPGGGADAAATTGP
jgi:hypothetical protein